jgi:hypothetical protein
MLRWGSETQRIASFDFANAATGRLALGPIFGPFAGFLHFHARRRCATSPVEGRAFKSGFELF